MSLSRKLYKRGERIDAKISLRVQTVGAGTRSVLEMTMKLVNRIRLVRAHMIIATIIRIIICFMIFPFSSCELPKAKFLP